MGGSHRSRTCAGVLLTHAPTLRLVVTRSSSPHTRHGTPDYTSHDDHCMSNCLPAPPTPPATALDLTSHVNSWPPHLLIFTYATTPQAPHRQSHGIQGHEAD